MKFSILLCGVVSISHDVIIKICEQFKSSTGDLTAFIPRYQTCEETETPRMIRFKSYSSNTVQIWWHVNLHCVPHNISQFSLPVCCRFMYGKVRENVEALLSLFSKYRLFVYGIAGLHVTSRRPCWWSRTKAFLSSGNETLFSCKFFEEIFFCFDPQHGRLVTWLQTKNWAVNKNGTLDLFTVWFMWTWSPHYINDAPVR